MFIFPPPILFSFLKFCSASFVIVLVEVGEYCSRDDDIAEYLQDIVTIEKCADINSLKRHLCYIV